MKIIFMGTPDFAVPTLKALMDNHEVVAVYTQPPRPANRGQKIIKSPIQIIAEENNINVRTPNSFKDEDEISILKSYNADIAIVIAYGMILPKDVLEAIECVNVHGSILPKYRGAAPIQRAIENGESISGNTIIKMNEKLDQGDILDIQEVEITKNMNSAELHDILSELGAKQIIKVLNNKPNPIKQTGDTCYAKKITKEEALINWNQDALTIKRKIQAFNPFPGAYFIHNEEKIKILSAEIILEKNNIGSINDNFVIGCKENSIRPILIQRSGKKVMPIDQFLKGFKIK